MTDQVPARRPVVYDITNLVTRLHSAAPTGIERVDSAFAHHFAGPSSAGTPSRVAAALHYGVRRPHLFSPEVAGRIVGRSGFAWKPEGTPRTDTVAQAVAAWLDGEPRAVPAVRAVQHRAPMRLWLSQVLDQTRLRLSDDRRLTVPDQAIYINVAQYAFEYPVFRWLDRRPDVSPVFFIHDMLPLDRPEFFRRGYEAGFDRRVATMARYAAAAIVSSRSVADRVAFEMRKRGRPGLPILAAHLPPPVHRSPGDGSENRSAAPYFLVLGTLEPRKNHLLLLNVWRDIARQSGTVPRLVLVGGRGWENEQVVDMLERCREIAPFVIEVAGLGTPGLRRLIAGARALLMASFDEGYGLPVAEALAAGTPVIASDIAVFREVSQGQALLIDPTDGPGWRSAVQAMAQPESALRDQWSRAAASYTTPTWPDYFATVEAFLATL